MNVRWRGQFKKDYKLMMRQGKDIAQLDYVVEELAAQNPLPEQYQDHPLKGDYKGYRECHIEPDWLLIYGYETLEDETLEDDECQLLLVRTGSHSDLFE
ncbi:MAG: type II toxin-antitoxin system YafQ family toxin [Gracilibacteraceae bacterium]|jgi:mRNA interferase YafQ|nr:type II toxin-antitoxin system YafQ family toxin [Gracilibacteraceae bacterium]